MFNLIRRNLLSHRVFTSIQRMSSDMAVFQNKLKAAKHVVILTGAGISAESGVPTFRGAGGFWRKYESISLASLSAFNSDPSLVWEFYHYRRELVNKVEPNAAHYAIVEFERRCQEKGVNFVVITQNVDDLHVKAGTKKLLRLHGSLYRVRCTKCKQETQNNDSPICPALEGRGAPEPGTQSAHIPVEQLPKCKSCGGLLRPAIVWFGENLDADVMDQANNHIDACDVCLVIGTSSVVYPAAMFAPTAAANGATVAEFNIDYTAATDKLSFHFVGPASQTVPIALKDAD